MTVLAPARRALPQPPGAGPASAGRGLAPAVAAAVAVLALVLALALAGGAPQPAPAGLPSAGPVTGWGVRAARLLADALALVTIGRLLAGAVLVADGPAGRRTTRSGGAWALAWSASLGALLVLTVSDIAGVPVTQLDPTGLGDLAATTRVRGLTASAVAAAVCAAAAPLVRTAGGARLLLAAALVGALPAYVTGHVATATDPAVALAGITVHVLAALLWIGGLVTLIGPLRRDPRLAVAAARYSSVALACYIALAMSGLVTAVARLGASASTWGSGYGGLVLAKAALLAGLGLVGHRHRRRTLPLLAEGRPRAFLRLGAVELSLMAAALGLAAALASTPPPPPGGGSSAHPAMTDSPLPFPVEPYAWWRLLTEWRPDAVVLVCVAVAAVLGLRHTQRRLVLLAGLAAVVLATCSGASTYAPSMLGVQVAELLLVLVVAPLLVAIALPRLADRVRPPAAAAAVLVTALLLGLYRSPLLEASLRSSWVSLAVLAVAAGAGLAVAVTVLDPTRPAGDRLVAGLPMAASLGLLAGQLWDTDRLVAADWFLSVRPRADLAADQQIAAVLLGVAALAVLAALASGILRDAQSAGGHRRTTTRPSSAGSGTAP